MPLDQELINRLENFEKSVMSNFPSKSVEELTNAKSFEDTLINYRKQIATGDATTSIKKKNLNTKETYYVVDANKEPFEVFTYKPNITDYKSVITEFESKIEEYNNKLAETPTFGEKAGKNNDYKIPVGIGISNITKSLPYIQTSDINAEETAKKRFKTQKPSTSQINTIKNELLKIDEKIKISEELQKPGDKPTPFFFRFDGPGFFILEIDKLNKTLDEKRQNIEKSLTEEINKALLSPATGIGFNPTIRNVIGIIMASSDAFLRKMSDVHKQAFDNGNSLIKKNSCRNDVKQDRKSTRLNSSHVSESRMPSSA